MNALPFLSSPMLTLESCETHQQAFLICTPRPTVEIPREATALMRAWQSPTMKNEDILTPPNVTAASRLLAISS